MSNTRHRTDDATPPAPEAAMSRDVLNIPDNVIQDGIKSYTEEQQDLIIWAFSYAREQQLGRARFCELIGMDWTNIGKVARGVYDASLDSLMDRIRDLQRRVNSTVDAGFVATPVTDKIERLMDYCYRGDIDGGYMGLIVGPTGRSKTHAVRHWCRNNNHGRSIYIDCPESGGLNALLWEIAGKVGVGTGRKNSLVRDRIIKSFSRRRMLVLDEVRRLMPGERSRKHTLLEFIRRLHDTTHCPVVMIATPVMADELTHGTLAIYAEQLVGRIEQPLQIPNHVTRGEVNAICTAYNKRPSSELIDTAHRIADEKGALRVLFRLLKQAAKLAEKQQTVLQAKHLSAAYHRRAGTYTWTHEEEI